MKINEYDFELLMMITTSEIYFTFLHNDSKSKSVKIIEKVTQNL